MNEIAIEAKKACFCSMSALMEETIYTDSFRD